MSAFKRLIVCCDGTWMNALGKEGSDTPPSNVWRICRLFNKVGADGTHQIVYYHAGVGSSGSTLDSVTGGDFGIGLDKVKWLSQLVGHHLTPHRTFKNSITLFA